MDYLGEVGIGSWEYADYAPHFDNGLGWITAGSGRIDLTGKPLGEALYTKVAFEIEKGPFIAVRPLCHEGKHSPSAWKMTNAMPSWSWRGFEGKDAHVEVYARASSVELFLNGQSRGRKRMGKNCVFTFHVPYENGAIEAVSYDENGKMIGKNVLSTAGEETVLQAIPEETQVKKGHLAFVRLQFTDKKGEVKPTERCILHVSVTGGKLRALGSACPYYELSYLDNKCDTYYGEALAIVEIEEDTVVQVDSKKGACETRIQCLP
jgi:beta-galactosidase